MIVCYHTIVINYAYLCLVKKEVNMFVVKVKVTVKVQWCMHNKDYNCNFYQYSSGGGRYEKLGGLSV